jgi:hypothetical protein
VFEDLIDQEVEDLQKNEDNDYPFQESTVAILKQVLKKLEVLLDNLQTFPDIPEPLLQVKGPFEPQIYPVEILILPCLRRAIKNI